MANSAPLFHFFFFELAEQFFGAYLLLKQRRYPIDWAAYFNFCHALEVGLKAFLILHGMTSEQVKNQFGHDLTKLMAECTRRGMIFTPRQKLCLDALGKVHSQYWSRYPKEDWSDGGVPTVDQFEDEAIEIINCVSIAIRGTPFKSPEI